MADAPSYFAGVYPQGGIGDPALQSDNSYWQTQAGQFVDRFGNTVTPAPQAAAGSPHPAVQAASTTPQLSGANAGGGTQGVILPGGGVLPIGQASQVASLIQAMMGGDANAQNALTAWTKGMGMSMGQLTQFMNGYNAVQQGAAVVQGSNGQPPLYRTKTGQYFSIDPTGSNVAVSAQQLQAGGYPVLAGYGPNGQPYYAAQPTQNAAQTELAAKQAAAPTPEAAAYQAAAATDPTMAGIISGLGSYYRGQQATTAPGSTAIPTLQKTYLKQQQAIDPTSTATTAALGQSYLQALNAADAGKLPQGVANQIQEAARSAQTARGNALGTSQAAQEAMATGLTGLQIKQQAQQNAQSWLSSGLTPGEQSAALYDWRTGMSNTANQNALSYLSSGQTPYGIGTGQLANTINQAQPSQAGTAYTPTYGGGPNFSYINPSAGQDFSTGSNNWYNSQTNAALGQGALANQQQANTFGLIGSALKAVGSIAGGAIGACWVARSVYGEDNPKWLDFRKYVLNEAPESFRRFYLSNGPDLAILIEHQPLVKKLISYLMDQVLDGKIQSGK